MKTFSEKAVAASIPLLGVGLYACGQVILANAGPLTGYQRIEGLLGLAAASAGVLVVGWWVVTLALALLSELLIGAGFRKAARVAGLFTPGFMRRLAAAMMGLHVLSGVPAALGGELPGRLLTAPIASAPGDSVLTSGAEPRRDEPPTVRPQWKPLPAPVDGLPLLRGQTRAAAPAGTDSGLPVITVRPGDSLWTIAAAHLGPFATDVEIADAWPRWHLENRGVIGDDPHLLIPGQLLRVPPTAR
ncbi:LysM peptidoglycan-binding domain-containing protein [Arthrobacter sp. Sr33]